MLQCGNADVAWALQLSSRECRPGRHPGRRLVLPIKLVGIDSVLSLKRFIDVDLPFTAHLTRIISVQIREYMK